MIRTNFTVLRSDDLPLNYSPSKCTDHLLQVKTKKNELFENEEKLKKKSLFNSFECS